LFFQDQIFLHEDEDGQLYFKDASGTLQPVYLTEDGNYAIAESSDDNTNKESQSKSNSNTNQNSNIIEEEAFVLPDIDSKSTSNKQVLFIVHQWVVYVHIYRWTFCFIYVYNSLDN